MSRDPGKEPPQKLPNLFGDVSWQLRVVSVMGTGKKFSDDLSFPSCTTIAMTGDMIIAALQGGSSASEDEYQSVETERMASGDLMLVQQTMVALGFRHFISDLGCQLVFYVHRVGRGMSFSGACLLSVFHAITISPRESRWAEPKVKAPRYTGTCVFLCWILHLLANIIVPMCVTDNANNNITKRNDFGYCSGGSDERSVYVIFSALLSLSDVLCLGIMPWASVCMVFILYRHKQCFQHLHGNSPSPRSSPESRAANIVLLLSTFVSLYTLSVTMHIWWAVSGNPSQLLVHLSALTNVCFLALSPFVLMSRDTNVPRLCCSGISSRALRKM
ncbi:Vomeronasal type-1 receptor 4 [Sciurus carolinensis]|uniref:Vomeronasal type-1 receptor n=1 Tax=Sciurus carolinensis TaxID=30640 RepID=A0AA41MVV6_SCICA|nr:Vomeronasal type-1 receptor 4 [Sciurus carolinensis]